MRQLNYSIPIPNATVSLIGVGPQPQVPGYTHTNAGYQSVVVNGNYAYVISSGGDSTGVIGLTLTIFNVANPTSPQYVSYITTGSVRWESGASFLNGAYIAAIEGNYLYIGSSGSVYLYVVNISNPASPFNVAYFTPSSTSGSIYGVAVYSNYVYLATQDVGLVVVNITNPLIPAQTFVEGGTLNKSIGVTVSNGYVYTTNYQTTSPWTVRYLKTWSLANPAVPVLLSTYTLPAGTKPAEVAIFGNTAFVADLNTNRVYLIDVTTPSAPTYLSTLQASATFDVTNNAVVDGQFAYVTSGSNATYGGAIDIFDITNRSAPVLIETVKEGVATSLFNAGVIYNNLLYIADYGVSPSYMSSLKIYSTLHTYSAAVKAINLFEVSGQAVVTTSTVTGYLTLQGSNDIQGSDGVSGIPTNWTDITSPLAITGAGAFLIPKTDLCYQNIRCSFNNSGTGSFNVNIKALGE
jgi:hypothetical protein